MNKEMKYIPEIGLSKNYSQIKVDKTCAQYLAVSNKNLVFDTAEEAVECANKMLAANDKTFYYMADPHSS